MGKIIYLAAIQEKKEGGVLPELMIEDKRGYEDMPQNAEDILAEAKSINEEREAKAEAAKVSDASEDVCECAKADEQEAEQTEVTAETAEA